MSFCVWLLLARCFRRPSRSEHTSGLDSPPWEDNIRVPRPLCASADAWAVVSRGSGIAGYKSVCGSTFSVLSGRTDGTGTACLSIYYKLSRPPFLKKKTSISTNASGRLKRKAVEQFPGMFAAGRIALPPLETASVALIWVIRRLARDLWGNTAWEEKT